METLTAEKLFSKTISFEIDCMTAICIVGNIQLATRHAKNIGESRKIAEAFARDLQKKITDKVPEAGIVLHMGWNPDFDIE